LAVVFDLVRTHKVTGHWIHDSVRLQYEIEAGECHVVIGDRRTWPVILAKFYKSRAQVAAVTVTLCNLLSVSRGDTLFILL
jgi:hypothetical protein